MGAKLRTDAPCHLSASTSTRAATYGVKDTRFRGSRRALTLDNLPSLPTRVSVDRQIPNTSWCAARDGRAMDGESPELVQAEDWSQPASFSGSTTPVFLIHDGGGTTFAYHCLNPLHRFVYGLANPYFFCGSRFEGGIPEMGRLYAERIRAAVAHPDFPARKNADGSVDVMLGGWSLGGLLSLEVAHVLSHDCAVRVVGILMIDSVSPVRPAGFHGLVAPTKTSEEGKTKNEILSQRCMAEARRMVVEWNVPAWQGRYAGRRPKMVLLRATNCIPTDGPGIHGLDVDRNDAILGWGRHDEAMFEHVVDVQGHHFDLFAMNRIDSTTAAVRRGLEKLERVVYPRGLRGADWARLGQARDGRLPMGDAMLREKDAQPVVTACLMEET